MIAVVCLAACSADDPPEHAPLEPSPIPSPEVSFEVAWKPETVVLDPAEQAQREVTIDARSTVVRIAEPSAALAMLAPGDHLVVSGHGLFEVLEVSEADDGALALGVTEGSLLDAADSGRIAWDVTLDPTTAVVLMPEDADPAWEIDKQLSRSLSFSGSVNGMSGSISIQPNGDRLDLTFSGEIPALTPYQVSAEGWIKRVRTTGTYEFEDGEITEYQHSIGDFELDGRFSIQGQGSRLSQKLSFPVGLYFPLTLGALPAFIGISGSIEFRSTAMSEDAGEVGGRLHLVGEAGFDLQDDDSLATVGKMEATMLEVEPGAYSSKHTSGIGVTLDFPRYDFGIGLVSGISTQAPSTSAALFMKVKAEAVQNVHVRTNLRTGEKRWCREAVSNAGFAVGGGIKVFGVSFDRESTIWAHEGEPVRSGPNCE